MKEIKKLDREIKQLRNKLFEKVTKKRELLKKITRSETTEKRELIISLRESGLTLTEVGKHFGVSRQRIFQIINEESTISNK